MNITPYPADVASLNDAAECAATLTKPAHGLKAAQYNHHAEPFIRESHAQATGAFPVGLIDKIVREQNGVWRYRVLCPFCGEHHMHGGGIAPVPHFGHRVADCDNGRGYSPVAVALEAAA